jgi:hypothetical protein
MSRNRCPPNLIQAKFWGHPAEIDSKKEEKMEPFASSVVYKDDSEKH